MSDDEILFLLKEGIFTPAHVDRLKDELWDAPAPGLEMSMGDAVMLNVLRRVVDQVGLNPNRVREALAREAG